MKRLIIFTALLVLMEGCATVTSPEHEAYFKLIDDRLHLVVHNKDTIPLTIEWFDASVRLWKQEITPEGELGSGVLAPNGLIRVDQIVNPSDRAILQLPDNLFLMPGDKDKTVVRLQYRCNGKKYHLRFEIQGRDYVDDRIILERMKESQGQSEGI